MALRKLPKKQYSLEEVAAEYGCSVSDLHDYAKDKKLIICKILDYSDKAIPLHPYEAKMLAINPTAYRVRNGIASLVITHEEKRRLKKKYDSTKDNDQDELSTTHPQEKLPTVLMSPDDHLVWTYEEIGKIVNHHKDNVLKLHKKEGLPLYWSAAKPYSTYYRLVSWVENREGKKRKTAKNFIKTENPQEK